MADVMTPEQRSRCMAAIGGKDTKPEILVRNFLFSKGLRYRLNNRKLPGSPDIVLKKYKTVIFVDGCFWHGHEGCKYFRLPKSNIPFWEAKITRNIERDKETTQTLTALGWKVIRIWECELRNKSNRKAALHKLFNDIKCSAVKRYSIEEPNILVAAESESTYSEG